MIPAPNAAEVLFLFGDDGGNGGDCGVVMMLQPLQPED